MYLLGVDEVKPEWSKTRQVELVEGHVYCLLPSVGPEDGFARLYPRLPRFILDLPCQQLLCKVGACITLNDTEFLIERFLMKGNCLYISIRMIHLQRYR